MTAITYPVEVSRASFEAFKAEAGSCADAMVETGRVRIVDEQPKVCEKSENNKGN
jgi:hypothetical protein